MKDSFATLDLEPQGFRALFSADWIWCDVQAVPGSGEPWQAITTSEDLASWETAWRENGSPADRSVFLPALLDNDAIKLLASWRDGRIVAGCVANRSDDLVGFSNFFAADDWETELATALATVSGTFPRRAIVGYEHGKLLNRMIALGFETVGPLRVWLGPET